MKPNLVLGAMTFGGQVEQSAADKIVHTFIDAGHHEIDTAFGYTEGRSEEILGKILVPDLRQRVFLATKAKPFEPGGLHPVQVRKQLEKSLKRLKTDYVDLFYLHFPDSKTPREETLEECQKLFLEGKFKKLGLSNYASWQVIDACYVCKINGWVTPTIYQGMYNAITRNVEYELFPALRSVGMAFYTYNPLAGGLLTGRYERLNVYPQTGRFAIMPLYKERYWKEGYFYAIDQLATTCKAFEIDMTSAALRWLVCHSMLGDLQGNSLIVGASSVQQIEMNLQSLLQGPLPAEVVDCFDHCWQQMKGESPAYFRS